MKLIGEIIGAILGLLAAYALAVIILGTSRRKATAGRFVTPN